MRISQEEIGPMEAKAMMEGNVSNRPINKSHVEFLARQIIAGAWQLTGDPIKISSAGRVLDGQHRLESIISAGINVQVFVARDVPEEVFTVLDTGKNRTARDVLHITGLKNATEQASLGRSLKAYYDGKTNSRQRDFTNQHIMEYCTTHDLLPSVNVSAMYVSKGAPVKKAIIAILHYILTEVDRKEGEAFLESVCLGVNIKKGTALYMLREKLMKAVTGRYDLEKWETVALAIKTWNLMRTNGELPSMINYNPYKESFPVAL